MILLPGSVIVVAFHIDVISDVICPWSYIGKQRLEKAVAALHGLVKVRWLPFQTQSDDAKRRHQPRPC
jgi:predicted DsbA family dithiol-disulfide isomerase